MLSVTVFSLLWKTRKSFRNRHSYAGSWRLYTIVMMPCTRKGKYVVSNIYLMQRQLLFRLAKVFIMPPPHRRGIKRWCCLTSDWRLSVAYIGPKSRTERPRKTKIGIEVAHITCDSDTTFKMKRIKGQGHRGRGILWRPPAHLVSCRKRSGNVSDRIFVFTASMPAFIIQGILTKDQVIKLNRCSLSFFRSPRRLHCRCKN